MFTSSVKNINQSFFQVFMFGTVSKWIGIYNIWYYGVFMALNGRHSSSKLFNPVLFLDFLFVVQLHVQTVQCTERLKLIVMLYSHANDHNSCSCTCRYSVSKVSMYHLFLDYLSLIVADN